jgi:hypothetical protein
LRPCISPLQTFRVAIAGGDHPEAQARPRHPGDDPEVQGVGEGRSEDDAEAGHHPVLQQEVADDRRPVRSQGPPGADLPLPLGHREGGQADDPQGQHQQGKGGAIARKGSNQGSTEACEAGTASGGASG